LSNEKEVSEKVKDMAKLTILSGRLNEIQEKNLKIYPFVFFNGVKSVKMDYDLLQKKPSENSPVLSNSVIAYHLVVDGDNGSPEVRYKALSASVKALLWDDITVSIYLNDKKVYESTNERR
jgi:hypothetical protein